MESTFTNENRHFAKMRRVRNSIFKSFSLFLFVISMLQVNGYAQVLLNENFTTALGTTPPVGWTNAPAAGTSALWTFNNPGERTITGGLPGFDGNFAMLDSDDYGFEDIDVSLESPVFDASGVGFLMLEFDNQVRYLSDQTTEVDVWNGSAWVNVYAASAHDGYPNPATHKVIDITDAADGASNAKVRFRFVGYYTWWWGFDNVKISLMSCVNVTSISLGDITAFGSTISWAGSGSVVIEYGPAGFTPGTGASAGGGTVVTTASSPYTIDGLEPETAYDVYVRRECTGGTYSDNYELSFTTNPLPPINDNCIDAVSVPVNPTLACTAFVSSTTMSATSSTTETAPTCGAGGIDDDVWFTFVATASSHQISLINRVAATGSSLDMATSVYSGSCGSLVHMVCSDPETFLVNDLTPGEVYYVRVWTWYTTSRVNFDICIGTPPAPPSNDNCAGAISLTVNSDLSCGLFTSSTTMSATSSTTETAPTCGAAGIDDDVWFSFVATSVSHRISLTGIVPVTGTSTDMAASVYSGTCGSLVHLICSDPETFFVNDLVPGNTYYVRVWTWGTSSRVNFNICIATPPPPPVNDNCAGAISLTVNPDYSCGIVTSSTTMSATSSTTETAPTCGASGIDDDVWFSFVATNAAHRISLINRVAVLGSSTDMATAVYSGTCGSLVQITCSDPETFNVTGLTIGTTYYVRVWTWGTSSRANFDICVGTLPPPPVNDDCSGAIAFPLIPTDGTCASVNASTYSASSSGMAACAGSGADDDVWYSFVCPPDIEDLLFNITTIDGNGDRVIEFFSGSCGTLTSILCSDPENGVLAGLTPGETYYFRIHTYGTGTNTIANVCLRARVAGWDCSNPILATELPYTHSSNTFIYGDNPDIEGSPGTSCGTTSGYLNGDDVVYQFTSPINGSVEVVVDDITNTYAGVFIYADCDDIGTSCIEGAYNGSSTADLVIADFPVTSGTNYYIVISTWASPQNTAYTLNININHCDTPDVLITGDLFLCSGNTGTVVASIESEDASFEWYASMDDETPIATTASFTTPTLTENTTYYVVGIDGICPSQRNPVAFTVYPSIPVSVGGDIVCIGETANLSALSDLSTATINWYATATSTEILATGNTFTTPPLTITSTYYVEAVSESCSSDRTPVIATVTTAPDLEVAPVAICYGEHATLIASSSESGTVFRWYGSLEATTPIYTGASFETPVLTTNTTYYVTATGVACASEKIPVTVTVKPLPVFTLSAEPVCYNATAVIVASSASSGVTYEWFTSPSGGTPIATGSSFTTAPIIIETLYYVEATMNGCKSARQSILVEVVNPTISASDVHICDPASVTLEAVSEDEAVINWFTTESGGSPVFTGSEFITPVLSTTTTYYVSATTMGCSTSRIPVQVIKTDIVFEIDHFAFCPTVTIADAPLSVTTTPAATILWYSDEALTDLVHEGNDYLAPVPDENTIYYVVAETDDCVTDAREVSITIYPYPAVSIDPMYALVCSGDSATFIATGTDDQTYEFVWYPTGVSGNILTTSEYGNHILQSTSVEYGCQITSTVTVDTIVAASIEGFNFIPEIFSNPYIYRFTPVDAVSATGYLWDFGDGNFSTEESPMHEYDTFGIYTVTLFVYNECDTVSVSLPINVQPSSGIDNLDEQTVVNVYPNPTNKVLNIAISENDQIVKIKIYNQIGQLMKEENVNKMNVFQIAVDNLAQGAYFIQIETAKAQIGVRTFVVQ